MSDLLFTLTQIHFFVSTKALLSTTIFQGMKYSYVPHFLNMPIRKSYEYNQWTTPSEQSSQ